MLIGGDLRLNTLDFLLLLAIIALLQLMRSAGVSHPPLPQVILGCWGQASQGIQEV